MFDHKLPFLAKLYLAALTIILSVIVFLAMAITYNSHVSAHALSSIVLIMGEYEVIE